MFRNYLVVAIRSLVRHKGYSLINVSGLTIGMACCVLILLFIRDELQYDRFHENGDRIYRLIRQRQLNSGDIHSSTGTSGAAGPALLNDFPEVEQSVRYLSWGGIWTTYGDKAFNQGFCLADKSILEVFTFPLLKGDPETALAEPFNVVLTERAVARYFGDEDPMGKTISVDHRYMGGEYKVTGILRDIPRHSTLWFDFLSATIPTSWARGVFEGWAIQSSWHPANNYILLREGADIRALEEKLQAFLIRYLGEENAKTNTYFLQPLKRVYLYSRVDYEIPWYSDITYVYLFSAIGLFVLLIACINFMNLATARSASRAREVGMRKVVGAYRAQLIGQFLGESVLLSVVALLLATGLVKLALPGFNSLAYKELSLTANGHTGLLLGLPCIAVFVGVLAGSYPALFLSAFHPAAVLKGTLRIGTKSTWFRKGLVVFQFTISVLLIVGTMVVYRQLEYMNTMQLGFNKEHIVLMPVFYRDRSLCARYEMVKNEFLQHPNVLNAAASHSFGALGGQLESVRPEGALENEWQMRIVGVDEDFLDTYGIELLAGRNLSRDIASDSTEAFLLNETAVRRLGWAEPVGKQFEWQDGGNLRRGHVIGVVRDFHNQSLREKIPPIAICKWQRVFNTLSLRIRGEDIPATMDFLRAKWQELIPALPFEANFMDEVLEGMYRRERRFGEITGIFSLLAVFVACLGLLGLASFTAQQRTREIGVRKALGASVSGVVLLLSEEFLKLVLVANLIAWPLAYYGLDNWLQNFEYRVSPGLTAFMLSGVLTLAIALATVSFQAVRAALINPVDALRDE